MEPGHVLPAHLGRFTHRLGGLGLLLRGRAVPLDDLIAPLAVHLVGLAVYGEELHFAIAEPVVGLERGKVAPVDAGHRRLEPTQRPGRRTVQVLSPLPYAPPP